MNYRCIAMVIALACLMSCKDNCVECEDAIGKLEFCDNNDINYTNADGEPVTFDEFIAEQKALGLDCK